jgi:hypothetical protein
VTSKSGDLILVVLRARDKVLVSFVYDQVELADLFIIARKYLFVIFLMPLSQGVLNVWSCIVVSNTTMNWSSRIFSGSIYL